MSTDAIRDVTKAMRELLLAEISAGRKVTLLPPGEPLPTSGSGVNLYLYRVEESPFFKNRPWPGDRAGNPPQPFPALSLELFYLLTPFGTLTADDPDDPAQLALGEAMVAFQRHPLLNHVHLPAFDSTNLPSDVADSYEEVKVRLHPVSLDELTKIWGTVGKPYRLSVVYEVTIVQLVPVEPPSYGAVLVQQTGVDIRTFDAPRLLTLDPETGALARFVGGATTPNHVDLSGFGFAFPGQTPTVLVGDAVGSVTGTPTDRTLTVDLPLEVGGGPDIDVRVRVNGRTSRPLTFTASPWVSQLTPVRTAFDATRPADLSLTLRGVGLQSAVEVRGESGGTPWQAAPPLAGSDDATLVVAAPTASSTNLSGTAVRNGFYEVRVRLSNDDLSNARVLEVIPQLNGVTGYAPNSTYAPATGLLTLNGRRLDGADVRVLVNGDEYPQGAVGGTGTVIAYTFPKPLAAGAHRIAVTVDGHRSRDITLTV